MVRHSTVKTLFLIWVGCILCGSGFLISAPKQEDMTPRRRTPMSVVKEAANRLNQQDLAWQFYTDYSEFFYGYARQYSALKVRTKYQKALQQQWINYFKELGDLVNQMQMVKQRKDNIRKNKTSIPYVERPQQYKVASVRHRQLLGDFIERAKSPPKQVLKLTSTETESRR